jgi:hypothetical protein
MALLADIAVTGTVPDRLAEVPDLVAALLESLLRGAPADAHMTGLAACAKAWLTTEDLLRQVVGAAAGEVWAWLERRPFVTRGPNGLFPHDLARDVLDAEFRPDDVSGDPEKLVRRFDEVTAAVVEPLYRTTLWFDRNRLAEIAADAGCGDGTAGGAGDPRWAASKALFAASLADENLTREYLSVAMLLSRADEVFAQPGMAERVMRLGAHAPRYPLPGPSRRELLAAIAD